MICGHCLELLVKRMGVGSSEVTQLPFPEGLSYGSHGRQRTGDRGKDVIVKQLVAEASSLHATRPGVDLDA